MGERPIFHRRVKKASAVKRIGAKMGSQSSMTFRMLLA
jgi:hypothetical protein